jgi:catalase
VHTPDEAIEIINERFGVHPRTRALHAKGNFCAGTFTATPVARGLSAAQHLQGAPVPVLARLSNGGGDPGVPDYAPDVRGLAVSFELPDGTRTDLSAQTAPHFVSPTSDDFLALVRANTGRSAAIKVPLYLATRPRAARTLPANLAALKPVASYATARYFTIHAYRWIAADGSSRYTRCTWIPEAGEQRLGLREARALGRDYLRPELEERLAKGPVRFTLEAQIAAAGDDPNDPSRDWPESRERATVGTLELDTLLPDQEAEGGVVVFDPTRVTDGIELSEDPVLLFRAKAYSASVDRRVG